MSNARPLGNEAAALAAPADIRRTLVIPIYRNAQNIADLVNAVCDLSQRLGPGLEIVFVIDGSPDASAQLLLEACKNLPFPSRIAFHSRNFGSFTAIRTGLELAAGDHVAAMAADLQEPPELIIKFFDILANDEADVAFGERVSRHDPPLRMLASTLFWRAYRRFVLPDIPVGGVDMFACNRKVREAILSICEPNSSLIAQLFWVGFRRAFVPYVRRPRRSGASGWNVARQVRYLMDSVFSFSDAPILWVLWFGVVGCLLSALLGVVTLIGRLAGFITEPGYATLLLVGLFYGSALLAAQGVIGCYLWRTFENSKRRPLRIITHVVYEPGKRQ
jgi:glycosyltransferase involved in cell wall biosynthesis